MHDTALEIGRLAVEIYASGKAPKILELGSFDVNGSLRQFAPEGADYVGVDLEAGKGVDVVVLAGKPLPFDSESFDLVIATSVFEHDPAFWTTFLDLGRVLRPGGFLYVNAPSNGAVHRYPEDHWRFYPDSGLALERWAATQGLEMQLIESFTASRKGDIWNDFVAVFRRGPASDNYPTRSLHREVGGANVWTMGAECLAHAAADTEDMQLLKLARTQIDSLAETVAEKEQSHTEIAGRLAILESTLRQRDEEIDQTRRQLGQALEEAQEVKELRSRLEEADAWVFKLAGERQSAQRAAALAEARERDALGRLRSAESARAQSQEIAIVAAQGRKMAEDALDQAGQDLNISRLKIDDLEAVVDTARLEAKERFQELAMLTRMLSESEKVGASAERQSDWLRQVAGLLLKRPWWLTLLPNKWRVRHEHNRLRRRGLFNAEAYLEMYPDVAAEGMDPIRHYVMHGISEGRIRPG